MSSVDPVQAGAQRMLMEQLAKQMWTTASPVSGGDDDSDDDSASASSGIDQFSGLFAQTLADALAPQTSTTKKAGA